MVYSYQGKKPNLSVYDNKTQVTTAGGASTIVFNSTENTLTVNFGANGTSNISINEKIRIAGDFTNSSALAGLQSTAANLPSAMSTPALTLLPLTPLVLAFPDDGFTLTETNIFVMSDESEKVEAFFEGSDNVYEGAAVNFSSQKIIVREKGDATKHAYTNMAIANLEPLSSNFKITTDPTALTPFPAGKTISGVASTSANGTGATFDVKTSASGEIESVLINATGFGYSVGDTVTITAADLAALDNDGTTTAGDYADIVITVETGNILQVCHGQFNITQTVAGVSKDSLDVLGLKKADMSQDLAVTTDWVDERAPAIKVNYDEVTQRLQFTVDRTVLGTGTESNFNSFSVFGARPPKKATILEFQLKTIATCSLSVVVRF